MLFEIRHVTQYVYDEPVRESVMELRMQPRKSTGQGLVSFDLEIEPPAQVFSYSDSYGNAVHHFDVPPPHQKLTIVARSVVETYSRMALPERLDRHEWELLGADAVRGECWDFLNHHGLATETEALRTFDRVEQSFSPFYLSAKACQFSEAVFEKKFRAILARTPEPLFTPLRELKSRAN